ncbi:MAG: TIGR02206 family membrane protein [Burkholderiales bacterium]
MPQDAFRAFTATHALAVITLGLLIAAWIVLTPKTPASARPSPLERALAWSNLAIWFAAHLWWIIPPALELRTTLPLQLCHVAAVLASVVLLTRRRWARTLVYFWGIGLSTQAILTPSLTDPPASIWFWGFWQQHGFLLAVALHDYFARGYRPGWNDFRYACLATFAYLLAILPVNLLLGANYGFVGDTIPETPSIVDVLGPWPERLAVIIGLVFVVFLILKLLGGGWRSLPGHQ